MPNHITTQVEIKGTKAKIKKLIKDTKIILDGDVQENQFDFNGIIKMPPELKNTTSPPTIVSTAREALQKNKLDKELAAKNRWPSNTNRYISQAEADLRRKKYNALDWYDWSVANWGTKWNAYDVHYTTHDDTKLVLQLDTAWDTPRGIWNTLEEQGFDIRGVMYGEMESYELIGDGEDVFSVYESVEVDYHG